MPIQGPRYQDGYEVIILTGKNHTIWTAYPEGLTAQFTMKEMDNSTVTPHEIDSSLAKIENENGFIPLAGTNHTQYSLPEPTGSGLVDSSRQHPFMQAFELDLSSYSGFIQVMFHHNSHDDNGIIIDDVVLTGTGVVGTKEVNNISLVAYPNPAVSEITIDLKEVNNYDNIRVYSMQGQLVKELKGVFAANGQVSIDVANLPTGVYQIEVINDSNKYYGKFSKK